jgi:hypothetical protein
MTQMSYASFMNAKRDTSSENDFATGSQEPRWRIAKFFRDHRLSSGLSLEDAALALGLEESSTLLGYESGIDSIPLDMIFALTNLLNIPPEDTLNLIHDSCGTQGRI